VYELQINMGRYKATSRPAASRIEGAIVLSLVNVDVNIVYVLLEYNFYGYSH